MNRAKWGMDYEGVRHVSTVLVKVRGNKACMRIAVSDTTRDGQMQH